MILLCLSIILTIIGAGLFIWGLSEPKSTQSKDWLAKVAIHEAGHAVSAWWCTRVSSLTSVTIIPLKNKAGCVYMEVTDQDSSDTLWCMLVIFLSGIVAEAIHYGKIKSLPIENDLVTAKSIAQKLVERKAISPWANVTLTGKTLPFKQMYKQSLSDQELQILEQGYRFAKQFILSRAKQHQTLVNLLLKQGKLNQEELEEIFGSRIFIKLSGHFQGTFVPTVFDKLAGIQ